MFLMFVAPLLATLLGAPPALPSDQDDQTATVRRIAATAALAAQEYGVGVHDGKVVAPEEVEEARLFLSEARRTAALLPSDAARLAMVELDSLFAMVSRTAPADSLALRSRKLGEMLAVSLGVTLDEVPSRQPLLARGAGIFQTQCASCHGPAGRGDGVAGAALTPPPADLTDFRKLAEVTPLDYYRRTTIGVAGTAMPAFESRLTSDERWAVALYATLLHLPAPRGEVPAALREFAATARMTDVDLATAVAPGQDVSSPEVRAHIAALRVYGTAETRPDDAVLVFNVVRSQLDSALLQAAAAQGERASTTAFDAYMTFEQVELGVRAKNPALANALEAGFAALRTRAAGGATAAELREIHLRLLGDLENAERTIGDQLSPLNLFVQSFVLLLREGLEAILVVGALMAFLVKTGAGHRRRDIHIGVGAAVGASLLTALLLETIFQVTRASQEALEGGVMLVATAMLFYVSYWLLSKMEVAKWNRFVKGRVQDAVSSGSALALASVAFLAVYREGFETVLFYKALFLAGTGSVVPVLLGMFVGGVALTIVYYAINRWGVKIPLKPFFGFTSAFLYYMAFGFAGKGIAELQEGGLVGTTVLPWAPRIPALGIYPTAESLALQAVLLAMFLIGLAWTFVIEPRRLALTNVLVPEPAAEAGRTADVASAIPLTVPIERPLRLEADMLRSLDRMDADLAALRAEVERLKGMLQRAAPGKR